MRLSFTILIISLLLSSCTTIPKPSERAGGFETFIVDFTDYAEKGFLITPYGPSGNYLGLGDVTITLTPKVIEITNQEYQNAKNTSYIHRQADKLYSVQLSSSPTLSYWGVEIFRDDVARRAVERLYQNAVDLGADAIVDFTIMTKETQNLDLVYTTYEISGFAIKKQ